MVISNLKAVLPYNVKKVWDVVTDIGNYKWRSDIDKIEIIDKDKFVEYTKNNYKTDFYVKEKIQYKCWKFEMENDNLSGQWVGLFIEKEDKTIIDFTENIVRKKPVLKILLKLYLKKQQKLYLRDLKKELRKRE
ncbi:MAG: polyketide cyclase [Epulopiscium sp.]|nr:polyketide cyclase [Candidatus Epulonipiscium sp.]